MRWRHSVLGIVLIAALQTDVAAATAEEVLVAKVEVLRELAAEGVFDAYAALADLAFAHPRSVHFDSDDGAQYLAMSAAGGRVSALRRLAYHLLQRPNHDHDSEREAATMIAIAALLGDSRATIDLRLWPKLTRLESSAIAPAFNRAVERLASGRIIDCNRLPFECLPNIDAISAVSAEVVLRARALRERGPYPDSDAVHAVFAEFYASYDGFPGALSTFQVEQHTRNAEIRARFVAEQADARRDRDGDWEQRAQLDRERMRKDAAAGYLAHSLDADIDRYRAALQNALDRINRHRSSADRIQLDTVIEWTRERAN